MSHIKGLLFGTAVALAGFGATAAKAEFINVLTGGTSGVYYPIGVALSEIYAQGIPNARSQVQATKASVENINLLASGRGEVALAIADAIVAGWEGDKEAGYREPVKSIRAIGGIYNNYIHVLAEGSKEIKTLADLKGHSLSVGAPASGTELNSRAIIKAAGMSYEDMSRVEYLPYAETSELMKNRQLDAATQSVGLGAAFIKDLTTTHDIDIVEIPHDIVDKIGMPFVKDIIPAGTYKGQDADVETAALTNYLITTEAVSEETVYQMTKLLFENVAKLTAAHSAVASLTPEKSAANLPIPLHPGAERYYREIGVLK